MKVRIAFITVLLISSSAAFGNIFDFSFNNSAGALKYNRPLDSAIPFHGDAIFQTGLLIDKVNNFILDVGVVVNGDRGEDAGGWLSIGTKALVGSIQNYLPGTTQNVASLMLGGELGYTFPAATRYSVAFYDYFGPSATTFGDANRAYQWGAHLDYDLNSGAKIYCEYREADFQITTTKQTTMLDSGAYVGIRLMFK
jgi:hypothetical protein